MGVLAEIEVPGWIAEESSRARVAPEPGRPADEPCPPADGVQPPRALTSPHDNPQGA